MAWITGAVIQSDLRVVIALDSVMCDCGNDLKIRLLFH